MGSRLSPSCSFSGTLARGLMCRKAQSQKDLRGNGEPGRQYLKVASLSQMALIARTHCDLMKW